MSRRSNDESQVDRDTPTWQRLAYDTNAQTQALDDGREKEDNNNLRAAPWRALFHFTTRQDVPLLSLATLSAVLAAAATPAQSHLSGVIFGAFTKHAAGKTSNDELMDALRPPIVYLVIVGFGSWLLHCVTMSAWLAFGELQAKSARDRLFEGLLAKDSEWYDMRSNGIAAILPRLQAQIRDLQLATAQPLGTSVGLIAVSTMSIAQSLVYSWKLTLVTLASAPFVMAFVLWVGAGMGVHLMEQNSQLSQAQKHANNAFAAIETVKCFNGQRYELQKFGSNIQDAAKAYVRVANRSSIQMAVIAFLMMAIFVQGFYYGGVLIRDGGKTVAQVVTTFLACISAFTSLEGIVPQLVVLEKGRAAGTILHSLLTDGDAHFSSIEAKKGSVGPLVSCGNIEVRNVTFTYPSRPEQVALDNVSMYIRHGEMVFLIGKSGSGKSTLGQLLMRFYHASQGTIAIDGRPLEAFDVSRLRSQVTLVEQTSVLFNNTIFQNIALGGKHGEKVTHEEVKAAADFALLQAMISDMPDGLNTMVGAKGGALSGGQLQRIALARARLRDTPILILDESTSALDFVSRSLIMEAIRQWRKGKTTIVITHDIDQIQPEDYAYILESGRLVQEGYRMHMELLPNTPFQKFVSELQQHPDHADGFCSETPNAETHIFGNSFAGTSFGGEGGSLSATVLDAVEVGLTTAERHGSASKRASLALLRYQQGSPRIGVRSFAQPSPLMRSAASFASSSSPRLLPLASHGRPLQLPDNNAGAPQSTRAMEALVERMGRTAVNTRSTRHERKQWKQQHEDSHEPDVRPIQTKLKQALLQKMGWLGYREASQTNETSRTVKELLSTVWPCIKIHQKALCVLGFWGCTIHAVVTPVFSWISSRLLATYARPQEMEHQALVWSMALLALSVIDASHCYLQRMALEYVGQCWIDNVRFQAMRRILDQPRDFFEKEENSVPLLVGCLDRNAEEMRNLLGRFAAMMYTAFVMTLVSITWALAAQWQVTLIALAIGPVTAVVSQAYAHVSGKWEMRSNNAGAAADVVSYEVFTSLKSVRALTLEQYFRTKSRAATQHALRVGLFRALHTGFFYALSESTGIFATATVFFVGGKAVQAGADVSSVIQVFTLLLFTITNVGAILEYVPQIGAAKATGTQLLRLSSVPESSHEHLGDTRVESTGEISLINLRFAYPSRPDLSVLTDVNLCVEPGSSVAIVGGSGSGKSTIAKLLVNLYPTMKSGELEFGGRDMRLIDTSSLRALIAIVPQGPTLFPATIADNIAYGLPETTSQSRATCISDAARYAGIHDFIVSLPQGYETIVGDGGMGLSGGQAQRVAIARALARQPTVLILDEATSALDRESASIVRRTVRELVRDRKRSMTIIIITHHRDMMEIADRIVVLDQGRIVEEGRFEELLQNYGPLVHLLSGGQWHEDQRV